MLSCFLLLGSWGFCNPSVWTTRNRGTSLPHTASGPICDLGYAFLSQFSKSQFVAGVDLVGGRQGGRKKYKMKAKQCFLIFVLYFYPPLSPQTVFSDVKCQNAIVPPLCWTKVYGRTFAGVQSESIRSYRNSKLRPLNMLWVRFSFRLDEGFDCLHLNNGFYAKIHP